MNNLLHIIKYPNNIKVLWDNKNHCYVTAVYDEHYMTGIIYDDAIKYKNDISIVDDIFKLQKIGVIVTEMPEPITDESPYIKENKMKLNVVMSLLTAATSLTGFIIACSDKYRYYRANDKLPYSKFMSDFFDQLCCDVEDDDDPCDKCHAIADTIFQLYIELDYNNQTTYNEQVLIILDKSTVLHGLLKSLYLYKKELLNDK
jgi:hypothetical protein